MYRPRLQSQKACSRISINSTNGRRRSPIRPPETGWGGRLSDQLASLSVDASVAPMISTGGNNLLVTGAASQALVIPTSGSFGVQRLFERHAERRIRLLSYPYNRLQCRRPCAGSNCSGPKKESN